MLQTFALLAAMSFGPADGGLNLTNERITFGGQFGPTRPHNRFLPGDLFFLAFDIEGLRVDPQGKVAYTMSMTVVDSKKKEIFKDPPSEQTALLPLGAAKLPAHAMLLIGLDLRGTHVCTVTVTDKATGVSKTVEKTFEVVPPAFGIVCFHTTSDEKGEEPAPMRGVAGQLLHLHWMTVGWDRNQASKQPHNQVEMRVFDSAGKPTTEQPLIYEVKKDVKEDVNGIEWHLPLPLNRPGTFTVELKAEDKLTGKTDKITFPVVVYDSVK